MVCSLLDCICDFMENASEECADTCSSEILDQFDDYGALCFDEDNVCESGVYDCNGLCDGTAVDDCAGTCEGTAVEDDCGVCSGGNSGIEEDFDQNGCGCFNEVCLGFDNIDATAGTLDIVYSSNGPISGFQFNISGITNISTSENEYMTYYTNPNYNEEWTVLLYNEDLQLDLDQHTWVGLDVNNWAYFLFLATTSTPVVSLSIL